MKILSTWGPALCILISVRCSIALTLADSSAVTIPSVPYYPGEKITYSVEYGFITAGKATLSVASIDTVRGIPCYHIQSKAVTNPAFSTFFRVDDQVDSYVSIYRLTSLRLVKHLREGKYRKDFLVDFDPSEPLAYYPDGDTLETTPHVQDVLSSLYYLRKQELRVGTTISIPHHDNKKNYPLEVKVVRKERVKVPAGKFSCVVVEPYLKDVGIFKAKGKIWIWLTDDEKKIPVLVKTSVIIGSVNAKLERYEEGTPLDIVNITDDVEVPVGGNPGDGGMQGVDSPLETGGDEDEVAPQDAGSQEDQNLPVQDEEEPRQSD